MIPDYIVTFRDYYSKWCDSKMKRAERKLFIHNYRHTSFNHSGQIDASLFYLRPAIFDFIRNTSQVVSYHTLHSFLDKDLRPDDGLVQTADTYIVKYIIHALLVFDLFIFI